MSKKLTMTVHEMAEELGICTKTAYDLVNRESFYPAFKIGQRGWCISREALEQWIREQTQKTGKVIV